MDRRRHPKGIRMKYNDAILWIAVNDESGNDERINPEFVADMITVQLIADMTGKTAARVAADVILFRMERDQIARRRAMEGN